MYIENLSHSCPEELKTNIIFKNKYEKDIEEKLERLSDLSVRERKNLLELLKKSFDLFHLYPKSEMFVFERFESILPSPS